MSTQEGPPSEKRVAMESELQTRNIRGVRWVIIVLAVLSSAFLYALDNTVTANVRPAIIQTFGNQVEMLI